MFTLVPSRYADRAAMRWTGVGAAIIAAADDALYLGMVRSQGTNPQFLRVPFVAIFIALLAICAGLSSLASARRWRSLLLGFSAAGLLLLGFFAIFSIGLALFFAGLLALAGLFHPLTRGSTGGGLGTTTARGLAAAGAIVAVVILLAGLSLTELAIRCPAIGAEGGGGAGFLSGSYQYSCAAGKLTISH